MVEMSTMEEIYAEVRRKGKEKEDYSMKERLNVFKKSIIKAAAKMWYKENM